MDEVFRLSRRDFACSIGLSIALLSSRAVASPSDTDPPLDPGNDGVSILPAALQPGDLLLSTTSSPISLGVQLLTGGLVSHVAVYLGGIGGTSSIAEARQPNVVIDPLQSAIDNGSLIVALRFPGLDLASDQLQFLVNWFTQRAGTPYNFWGSVADWVAGYSGFLRKVNLQTPGNAFYCSELVIEGYAAAGLLLTTSPAQWSPTDIADLMWTDRLQYVGHLKFIPS